MFSTIDSFVRQHNLLNPTSTIVIGLSGGPDSVFLLHYLAHCKQQGSVKNIIAAHLDHGWRENSHHDIEFCRELTNRYDVRFVAQKLSDLSISLKSNGSQEEVGRLARRFFLEHVREQENADVIALAHHAQDQQETFFIRMLRGASLAGLAAMRPHHGQYIRPLLEINKPDIIAFLTTNNIPYLIDPTNVSDDYLRNRIRNHVLPALTACDQRFDVKFLNALNSIQASENFLNGLTQQHFAAITQHKDDVLTIDIKQLLALDPIFHHRILVHWFCQEKIKFPTSSAFFDETMRFLNQHSGGTHALNTQWKLRKSKGLAFILR